MAYTKQYEEKPNTGSLHHKAVKKSDKSPDYTGSIVIDLRALGVGSGEHKLRLSGWKRVGKTSGKQYLSLAVSTFEEEAAPKSEVHDDPNDDIPF